MNLLKEKLVELKGKYGKKVATLALAGAMGVGAGMGLTGCDGIQIGGITIGGEKYTMPDGNTYKYQELLDNLEDIKAINEQNEADNGEKATLSTEQFEKLIALYNKDIVDNHQEEVFKAIQDAFGIDASTLSDDELIKISRPYYFSSKYYGCLKFAEGDSFQRVYMDYNNNYETTEVGGGYSGIYWFLLIPIKIEKNSDGVEKVYYKRCEDFDARQEYSLSDVEDVYNKVGKEIGSYFYAAGGMSYFEVDEFKKAIEESEANYACEHVRGYIANIDENVKGLDLQ